MNIRRTGLQCVDDEHAKLMRILCRLRDDFDCGDASCEENGCALQRQLDCDEALISVLSELLGFASEHFASEERLMGGLSREESYDHKRDHDRIAARLAAVAQEGRGKTVLTSPAHLEALIRDWLVEHVDRFDVPLASRLTQSSA